MEILQIANSCMIKLQTEQRDRFIIEAISDLKLPEQFSLVDKIFNSMAEDQGTFQCNDFVSKSLIAMRHLQRNNKCNIMYGLAKDLGTFRSNGESLLNVHKMPFGLLAYNIMFFSAEHVYQVWSTIKLCSYSLIVKSYDILNMFSVWNTYLTPAISKSTCCCQLKSVYSWYLIKAIKVFHCYGREAILKKVDMLVIPVTQHE